ncbi:MAG: hypothetical protein HRU28_11080 [Rhizobiales bacterium]|nr:hypothetical protein [Hyphomicrobiales bacterium]
MKFYRIFSIALIAVFAVMQVSQLQAAGVNKVGYYDSLRNKYQKPTLRTCKRSVSGNARYAKRQASLKVAKHNWIEIVEANYGSRALWSTAKDKRQTCRFDSSTGLYNCKFTARPCFSGGEQNSQ